MGGIWRLWGVGKHVHCCAVFFKASCRAHCGEASKREASRSPKRGPSFARHMETPLSARHPPLPHSPLFLPPPRLLSDCRQAGCCTMQGGAAEGVSDVSSLLLSLSCPLCLPDAALTPPLCHAYPFAAAAPPLRLPALFSWSCARCGRVEADRGAGVHAGSRLRQR